MLCLDPSHDALNRTSFFVKEPVDLVFKTYGFMQGTVKEGSNFFLAYQDDAVALAKDLQGKGS